MALTLFAANWSMLGVRCSISYHGDLPCFLFCFCFLKWTSLMTLKTQRQTRLLTEHKSCLVLQASGFVGSYHVYNSQSNVDQSWNFFSTADSCAPTFFCLTATVVMQLEQSLLVLVFLENLGLLKFQINDLWALHINSIVGEAVQLLAEWLADMVAYWYHMW